MTTSLDGANSAVPVGSQRHRDIGYVGHGQLDNTLYVNGRFFRQPQSGVQRFATEITAALRRLQPDRVTVLGPPGTRALAPFARDIGRRQGQFWEQFELPSHARGGMLVNLGNTAPLRRSTQLVVIHDAGVFATPTAYSWKFRLWYKLAQRRLVRGGACVVAVSAFGREELVRNLGAEPGRIAVVSEGADHMAGIVADQRILARLPAGRFVLAVGNLAAHKNLVALGALARQLAERGNTLVVTGGLATGAFQEAPADHLPQPACYVGRVSDGELKALYEAAACLVFPSRYEGFGLPAVEAMACGCPVVASRIPGLQETCGDAAIYVDPASPADISAGVRSLLDDAAREASMRARARERASRFTWSRAAGELADIADAWRAGRP